MASRDTKLQIIIDAQDRSKGVLDRVHGNLARHEEALSGIAVASGATLAAIGAVGITSINAYADAERSARQLEYAIIGVSKGTKAQVEAVREVTLALERKVGVDADSVNQGVAQLSTFGLQSESVVKLTKSLADLTINQRGVNASAEDYQNSANVMAKALNGQFGQLERIGIRFTEAQQAIILYGTEAEKVAALQEGLAQNLKETSDTVGGVDVAMGKLRTSMGAIQEGIGAALIPALNELLSRVQPVIEKVAAWIEQNPQLAAAILGVTATVAGLTFAMTTLALAVIAFTTVAWPIVGMVALIGAAMIAFAATIYSVSKATTLLYENWRQVWVGIKLIAVDSANVVIGVIESMVNYVIESINSIVEKINKVIALAQKLPGIGDKFSKIGTLDTVSLNRVDAAVATAPTSSFGSIAGSVAGAAAPIITGNVFLNEDVATYIGDMIMGKLKFSSPI